MKVEKDLRGHEWVNRDHMLRRFCILCWDVEHEDNVQCPGPQPNLKCIICGTYGVFARLWPGDWADRTVECIDKYECYRRNKDGVGR